MNTGTPIVELQDVRFRYPGHLRDTLTLPSLGLSAGQGLLVQGGSGCGKSTLLSLVAGVLLADAGRVCLLGQDWQSMRPGERDARRVDHVGYVFQQFNLLPYLDVINNVLLPCRFSALRRQRAQQSHGSELAAARALLQSLDLEEAVWRQDAAALSVGQQQRVAAARALIGQPELVIADEPTSALDEDRRDAFMQLLTHECARSGSALLFVSHDRRLAHHFERVLDLPALQSATQPGAAS